MPGCNPIVSLVRGEPRFSESKEFSVEELEEIYTFCREKIPKLKNRGFADFMNLMRDMVHEMTVFMVKEKRAAIPCRCGKKLIVIYDNGDVFPCELLDYNMGNLREHEYNLQKILNIDENKKFVKNIIDSKCYCTWECALNNNILFSKKHLFNLMYRFLKSKIA